MTTLAPTPPFGPYETAPADGPVGPPAAEPYKFLDYFEECDEQSFSGRTRDIQECIDRITTSRLFVIYARSGFGKTSLLKAGVFPRLRERGLRPVYVRTLQNPVRDLRAALLTDAWEHPPSDPSPAAAPSPSGSDDTPPLGAPEVDNLKALIRRLPSAGRIVLVLDQFEEFFIRFRDQRDVRKAFVEVLSGLVSDTSLDVRVVFSLREDYLAELEDFEAALPHLFDRAYRLAALTAFGAREAITRPLDQFGVRYSPTIVTRMVEQLDAVDLDPPLLQIFCTEVYRQAIARDPDHPEMTEEDVRQVGGLDGIFRRYLNAVTEDKVLLADPLLARNVLDALLTQEHTKRAATVDDIISSRFRATKEEVAPILGLLVGRYLLRRSFRDRVEWFELIHERLVPFVQEWLDRDATFLNFRLARDLIAQNNRGEYWRERPNLLLNAGQVEEVVGPYRGRLWLSASEIEFVYFSALVSRSDEAGYWADQVGRSKAVSLLLGALASPDRALRLGAASVAGVMPDPTGLIAGACLGFSGEEDPDVRRAAARSFSRLLNRYGPPPTASPAEAVTTPDAGWWARAVGWADRKLPVLTFLARRASAYLPRPDLLCRALVRSIRQRGLSGTVGRIVATLAGSRPDLDFLATRAEEGDRLLDAPLWKRFYARSIAYERLRNAESGQIRGHAFQGSVAGLIAGALWVLTIGYGALHLSELVSGKGLTPGTSSSTSGGFALVVATILSGFVGYFSCVADARGSLLSGRGFHPFRMARSNVLVAPFAILMLFVADEWLKALAGDWPIVVSITKDGWAFYLNIVVVLAYLVLSSPAWNRPIRIGLAVLLACWLGYLVWGALSSLKDIHDLVMLLGECVGYAAYLAANLVFIASFLAAAESMSCLTLRCLDTPLDAPPWLSAVAAVAAGAWIFSASFALPMLLLAALNLSLVWSSRHYWAATTEILAVVLSYLIAVGVASRFYAWRAAPLPLKRPEPVRSWSTAARAICLGALALAPVAFNLVWGFNTFLFTAPRIALSTPGPHTVGLSVGPAAPDFGLARLTVREPATLLLNSAIGLVDQVTLTRVPASGEQTSMFDLRLLSEVPEPGDIPASGVSLVVVAKLKGQLYFRILDAEAKTLVDTHEALLRGKEDRIAELKQQLETMWPPHVPTNSEKDRIILAVTSIVGHTESPDRMVAKLKGPEPRWMPSLHDVGRIPDKGRNLVIVADVMSVLHFRVFDGNGTMVVDTDETRLTGKVQEIAALGKDLRSSRYTNGNQGNVKAELVADVMSILGQPQVALREWYFFPAGLYTMLLARPALAEGQRLREPIESARFLFERAALPPAEGLATPEAAPQTFAFVLKPSDQGLWSGRISGRWPATRNQGKRPEIVLSLVASSSFTLNNVRVSGADTTHGRSGPSKDVFTFAAARPRTAAYLGRNAGVAAPSSGVASPSNPNELTIRPTLNQGGWAITVSGNPVFEAGETAADPTDITVYATLDRIAATAGLPPATGQSIATTHTPASDPAKQAAAKANQLQASLKRSHEDWAGAVKLYRLALAAAHDGAEVHEGLARALKEAGDLGAAIDEARVARRRAGDEPKLTNNLAWYLCLAGRFDEALPFAREATALPPWNATIQHLDTLAHAAYGAGQWGEAVEAWNKVLALEPGYFQDKAHVNCEQDLAHFADARRRNSAELDRAFPRDPLAAPARADQP